MLEPNDLPSLATLHALLEEVSVSNAARRLGLSTPAVSHALARLRERFDDPLLVRAGRRMVLTPRAEALAPIVRDAIAAAGRVFAEEPDFSPERMRRQLTVSATDYVLLVFGAALDEVTRTKAPGLDLRFVPNAVDDAERLRAGTSDLAIGIYEALPPELRTRPIIGDRLVCVVRSGHPRVRRRLTLDQFLALEHVQIAPRGQPGGSLDDALAARGLTRRVARAVPYFRVALELVAHSDRVLTVSERIARALAPSLGLTVYEPPLRLEPFTLSLVWHPRFDADRGHAWLRERLVEVTREADPRGV
jgi:DNA-binding transcriptional LysR family regulator